MSTESFTICRCKSAISYAFICKYQCWTDNIEQCKLIHDWKEKKGPQCQYTVCQSCSVILWWLYSRLKPVTLSHLKILGPWLTTTSLPQSWSMTHTQTPALEIKVQYMWEWSLPSFEHLKQPCCSCGTSQKFWGNCQHAMSATLNQDILDQQAADEEQDCNKCYKNLCNCYCTVSFWFVFNYRLQW